jgi:predicted transport protein
LNGGYNIYPERVRRAAEQYKNAIPSWLTIQLDTDRRCYSAYFGRIDSLRNPLAVAVPMTPRAVAGYECLACDQFDPAITSELSNQLVHQIERHVSSSPSRITSGESLLKERRRVRSPSTTIVSFQDHVAYADPPIQPLLRQLRTRIIGLEQPGRTITEKVTKHQRIAYSAGRVFAEIKVQKKRVLVRFFDTGVVDFKNLVMDVPATHKWQQDKEIALDNSNLADYAMRFIEPSYKSHRAS